MHTNAEVETNREIVRQDRVMYAIIICLVTLISAEVSSLPLMATFISGGPVSTKDKAMMRNPIRGRVHQNNGEAHFLFLEE